MSQKIEIDGEEVEVFTTEEVAARETATRTQVEGEFAPKLSEAQKELERVNGLLGARTTEFGQLRKLSDEQVAKLTVAERTIYENGLALNEANKKNAETAANNHKASVAAAIRAKVGTDEALFKKASEMYEIIGLDDQTPDAIAKRVTAALGALGSTEPDLLAAAGFTSGGSFEPPKQKEEQGQTFADTEQGKAGAAELGIIIEAPKK